MGEILLLPLIARLNLASKGRDCAEQQVSFCLGAIQPLTLKVASIWQKINFS